MTREKIDKSDEEWRRVLDAFSVQETAFWREFSQIEALTGTLVPPRSAASAARSTPA